MQIVWFKRDLRVYDHEPLVRAARLGPALPLYIVEPGYWAEADASGRQWDFLRETLLDLRAQLAALGQPLVVRYGDAAEVLRELATRCRAEAVWSHQETGNAWTFARDRAVAAMLRDRGITWHELRQHGVVRGAVDRNRWSRQWEALVAEPLAQPPTLRPVSTIEPGTIPDWPSSKLAPDPCPGRQAGGRTAAEGTLQSFLARRGARYHRDMSSPLSAENSCSRLSPHLAVGSLSLREVVKTTRLRLQRARQDRINGATGHVHDGWQAALAAFEGRLHWHCHFIQKLEREPELEWRNLHSAVVGLRDPQPDPDHLRAWCHGETGWPLVDACMRFLDHHGWINFRMRAMLMSIASYQLWMHWRQPGLHLARRFVDYEPGIHWPQVQMQSGTTGINSLRIYNPVKQSRDQDPHGRFIRRWLPELAPVDNGWIHTPWAMPAAVQRQTGVHIGRDYPAPLVDHASAARLARQRVKQARHGADARDESRAIHERHGSRRRSGRVPLARGRARAQRDMFDDGA